MRDGGCRIASTWQGNSYMFKLNVTGTVAFYFLDWNRQNRKQKLELLDEHGKVIDTRVISNFQEGLWVVYSIVAPSTLRITLVGTGNAVVTGIFLS
jgi:hypothetical protein